MSAATDPTVAYRISGFVDLQINGGFGYDFTAHPESIWDVAARLPAHGVTAFLPTIVSSPPQTALEAFRVLAAGPPSGWSGARPLGLHLEGPFLAASRRGTHASDALVGPDLSLVDEWIEAGPPRMVTLAPELAGASSLVARLWEAGTVVALGHSNCSAEEATTAFDAGATHVTHLFNAMSGLDHRSPGLAAAALGHEACTVGLIADGVHVHPGMLRVALRALGASRIALVTDAIAGLGVGDGRYRLGDTAITVSAGTARNDAGDLAGATAPMPHLVRTMIAATGSPAEEALAMASTVPARIVGFAPPSTDEVLLTHDFEVISAVIDDVTVFRGPSR